MKQAVSRNKSFTKPRMHDIDDNVRFDYSNTHFNNEDLQSQLSDLATAISRDKYLKCIATDALLKKAKQSAAESLQLKNKVKNRDPNESARMVLDSADLKRRPSSRHLSGISKSRVRPKSSYVPRGRETKTKTLPEVGTVNGVARTKSVGLVRQGVGDNNIDDSSDDDESASSKDTHIQLRPTLTSFNLANSQHFPSRPATHPDVRGETSDSSEDLRSRSKELDDYIAERKKQHRSKSAALPSRHKSSSKSRHHVTSFKNSPAIYYADDIENEATEAQPRFGINVKKDFTRSRRALEEVSRLEEDALYGYVNKYEERRRRLLAQSKDTRDLDDRIKGFLRELEQFKVLSVNDRPVDKVVIRPRTAFGTGSQYRI